MSAGIGSTRAEIFQRLKLLLEQNERDVKEGTVPLCLTPEVLLILNHGFEHMSDMRTINSGGVHADLQYLQTSLHSTSYLRLTHGGCNTIQAPVDLSPFRHLTQVEVKRIPPHWIIGLDKLRDKLHLIRVSRSVNYLEDLLGRVNTGSQSNLTTAWTKLTKLFVINNFIKELDQSLTLTPLLEVLDLSQNYLTSTGTHLQSLTELAHVNLAFNSLTAIPRLCLTPYPKIKTLVLKSNHLEHIQGVEVLVSLETLDVSNNMICDHGCLISLTPLIHLKQLYLEENPLSNNPRHRVMTGAFLTHSVVLQLSLDSKAYDESEVRASSKFRAAIRPYLEESGDSAATIVTSETAASRPQYLMSRRVESSDINVIEEIPQPSDDVDRCVSHTALGTDVSAVDDLDASQCSPVNGVDPHATKLQMDNLRNELKDDWLNSFNAYNGADGSGHAERIEYKVPADSDKRATGLDSNPASQYGSVNGYSSDSIEDTDDSASVHSVTEDQPSENGLDGSDHDPFIVKFADGESEEFLVMVTDHQIIEKNIRGIITEMLDLSALIQLESKVIDEQHLVKCKFDYFRKDRRERLYVMEDLNDSVRLVDILQPIVLQSQASRFSLNTYECLKCGKQYEMNQKIRRKAQSAVCPYCHSDMVIELSTTREQRTSTPYGSPNSTTNKQSVSKTSKTQSSNEDSVYLSIDSDVPSDQNLDSTDSIPPGIVVKTNNNLVTQPSYHTPPSSGTSPSSTSLSDGVEVLIKKRNALHGTPDDTISYVSLSNQSETDSSTGGNDELPEMNQYVRDTLTGFRFDPADLSYIDHRLKLYLSVTYFDDGEQPLCTLRCKCVTYSRPDEYPSLLVLTDQNIYLFRVHQSLSRRGDLGGVFDLLEKEPLSAIHYIEIGLEHNNVRIELEKAGYCILLRDPQLGKLLHAKIAELMRGASFSDDSKLRSINKINQEYYNQISSTLSLDTGSDNTIRYAAAFIQTTPEYNLDLLLNCQPVSLVVDNSDIYLMKENYHLPFTRGRLKNKQKYLTKESSIPISDIAHLRVCESRCELHIEGFEEQASEFSQKLLFSSLVSLNRFISFLLEPWRSLYGVELQINLSN